VTDFFWQEKNNTMKQIFAFLFFTTFVAVAQEEYSLPKTPKRIEFANVIVTLDDQIHKEVENLVTSLLTPRNSYLDAKLERMQWYFPFIEKILEDESLPDDLKYLSVLESSLEPDAISTSGAVGFWQFKEPTAKELGLVINRDIDERKNIFESTRAAATYLKKNNIIYKNWISSVYAYNQGLTGAAKDIPDGWSYAGEVKFTNETPKYLLKALAHRIAYEHRLNRLKSSPKLLISYPAQNKSLAEIAVEFSVDLNELRNHNKWLNAARIPTDKEYIVMIPTYKEQEQETRDRIVRRRDLVSRNNEYPKLKRVTQVTTSEDAPVFYEINGKRGILASPGDEAAQVAKKARLNLMAFLKLNDMTDRDLIKTDQVYYLEKKNKKATAVEFHAAAKDETFWDVSQRYGIQLKSLLKMNRLKRSEPLAEGRVVWLSRKRPANQPVEIIRESVEMPEENITPPVQERYIREESIPVTIEPAPSKPVTEPQIVAIKPSEKPVEEVRVRVVDRTEAPVSKPVIAQPKYDESVPDAATHVVKQGETLYSLAQRYHLSVNELRELNNMGSDDVLQYNQRILVSKNAQKVVASGQSGNSSVSDSSVTPSRPVAARSEVVAPLSSSVKTHVVERGQTLYSISKLYNSSVEQLREWNNLSDNTISLGQTLRVSKGVNTTVNSNSGSYVVKQGDTLFNISQRFGVSVNEIKTWNNLSDNSIKVGQTLRVR
jgi:membrane-bound lytic murein transglycosylase D